MAAPVPTGRGTPDGRKMKDGYRALITFATNPSIEFWEKDVKPPGFDGGDKIDQTTMHNDTLRTFASRSLFTLTDGSCKAAYDPAVYDSIQELINVETTVTYRFHDGSTVCFFGFLQKFEPDELKEGDLPQATVTISPTNTDPATGEEEDLVYTAGTGS